MSTTAGSGAPFFRRVFIDTGRLAAFGAHLAISGAIVCAVTLVVWLFWNPGPFFMHDGGLQMLRMLVMVDVVVGPMLTLLVFRRGKPELRRDLAVIALIQLVALAYGVGVAYMYRPAFAVMVDKNFFSVNWPDIRAADSDVARIEGWKPLRGPGWAQLVLPTDPAGLLRVRERYSAPGAPGATTWGDYYAPMDDKAWESTFARSANIEAMAKEEPDIRRDLDEFLAREKRPVADFAFVPMVMRYGVVMLAIDRKTKTVAGVLG